MHVLDIWSSDDEHEGQVDLWENDEANESQQLVRLRRRKKKKKLLRAKWESPKALMKRQRKKR